MDASSDTTMATPTHELCFASLHDPGRAVTFPCDAAGQVDLDGLSERLRNAYLGTRARIGRDFGYPTVAVRH